LGEGSSGSGTRRAPFAHRLGKLHFENVQTTRVPVDRVDKAPVIHVNVVDLDRACLGAFGSRRYVISYLFGVEGIREIVDADAAAEETSHDHLIRLPSRFVGMVLVNVVGAESSASLAQFKSISG